MNAKSVIGSDLLVLLATLLFTVRWPRMRSQQLASFNDIINRPSRTLTTSRTLTISPDQQTTSSETHSQEYDNSSSTRSLIVHCPINWPAADYIMTGTMDWTLNGCKIYGLTDQWVDWRTDGVTLTAGRSALSWWDCSSCQLRSSNQRWASFTWRG